MSTLAYSLVSVIFLLAANAFFVAAEFALVKVRGYQLDQTVIAERRSAEISAIVDESEAHDAGAKKKTTVETMHGRYPVLDENGDVVGILATKDMTSALIEQQDDEWDHEDASLPIEAVKTGWPASGQVPRENDKFVDSGYDFFVARMHGRQVHTVMISPSKKTKQNLDTAPVDGNTN